MSHKKTTSLIIAALLVAGLAGAGGFLAGRRAPLTDNPAPPASGGTRTAPPPPEARINGQHETAPHENDPHRDDPHADESAHRPEHDGKPEKHHEGESPNVTHAGEGHGHDDGHGHGEEGSDLDRSVEDLWAARCEHDIPQHQCDECRYELGAVKLDGNLLGPGGLVATGFPEKKAALREALTLPGEVQLDETRTVHVASPLAGRISRGFTMPGVRVEAGAPLFEVDSPEVAEAKSAFLKARASLSLARKAAEREKLLFRKKIAAHVEVLEAEAREAEAETEVAAARGRLLRLGLGKDETEKLSTAGGAAALDGLVIIRAPRSGTVIEGHANPGEFAETGKEILTLSDLDTVWVEADVKESDLAALTEAAGGHAEVQAMGRTFSGKLETVAGRMSEQTRTAKARFTVTNSGGLLKPGMFVSTRLLLAVGDDTLAVPKTAVLADAGRTFVFVHKEGDYWLRRPVTLGKRFDGMVEIADGLAASQRIITDGSFLLKSDILRSKMGAGCAD